MTLKVIPVEKAGINQKNQKGKRLVPKSTTTRTPVI